MTYDIYPSHNLYNQPEPSIIARQVYAKSGFCTEKHLLDIKLCPNKLKNLSNNLRNATSCYSKNPQINKTTTEVAAEAISHFVNSVNKELSASMISGMHADLVTLAVDKSHNPGITTLEKLRRGREIVMWCKAGNVGRSDLLPELEFSDAIVKATIALSEHEKGIAKNLSNYHLEILTRYAIQTIVICKSDILKTSCLRTIEESLKSKLEEIQPVFKELMSKKANLMLDMCKENLMLNNSSRILTPAVKDTYLMWFYDELSETYDHLERGREDISIKTTLPPLDQI